MGVDEDYANAAYIPGGADYPEHWATAAADWRSVEAAVGRAWLNLRYGDGARQVYDLFYPAGRPEGLCVFIHGGFWRAFDKTSWSHLAAGVTARGWAMAMPSYTLVPEVRIRDITVEIATAITAAATKIAGPVSLVGHSAGGHLVARMLCPDVALGAGVAERMHHVVPISPLGDLRPLLGTEMNADFRLDPAEAAAESPILCTDRRPGPVTLWVGGDERPGFLAQAQELAAAWAVPLQVADGRHHFDVIDALAAPESTLVEALVN